MTIEAIVTWQMTSRLRVVRDDSMLAWSSDLRSPDRLQQLHVSSMGQEEWRDVEVVGASKINVSVEGQSGVQK